MSREYKMPSWLTVVVVSLLSVLGWAEGPELYVLGIHPHALVIFDGSHDQVVAEIQTRGRAPKNIVPSPDGKFLYVTTEGRSRLEVVNVADRSVEKVFDLAPPGQRVTIFGLEINSGGDRLYIHVKRVKELVDEYKVLPPQIWSVDVKSGETQNLLEVPEGVGALALAHDGRRLYAWGRDVYVINLAERRIVDRFRLLTRDQPGQALLDTGPPFVQCERSGIFSVPYYATDPIAGKDVFGLANLDLDLGTMDLMELGAPIPLYSVVVSPDRKRAYGVMNQVIAVDMEARKLLRVTDVNRTHYAANISRDGRKLYLAGGGPFLHVYDTGTMQLVKTVELSGDGSITELRALPAGAMH